MDGFTLATLLAVLMMGHSAIADRMRRTVTKGNDGSSNAVAGAVQAIHAVRSLEEAEVGRSAYKAQHAAKAAQQAGGYSKEAETKAQEAAYVAKDAAQQSADALAVVKAGQNVVSQLIGKASEALKLAEAAARAAADAAAETAYNSKGIY